VDPVVLKAKKTSLLEKSGYALMGLGVAVGIACAVLFVMYKNSAVPQIDHDYCGDYIVGFAKNSELLHWGIGTAVFAGGVFAAGSGLLIAEQMKKRKKADLN